MRSVLDYYFLSGSEIQAKFKCELTYDPGEVKLFYEHMKNFKCSLGSLDSAEDAEAILQKEYIDRVSLGLREYLKGSGLKAEDFIAEIENSPTNSLYLHLKFRRFPYGIARYCLIWIWNSISLCSHL